MAQIQLESVTKRFGDGIPPAVKSLTMTIQDGEFLVLLGPSGCGKTTTLRMIAGLETQSDGDIFIGDRRVNDLRPGDRDIAFVFQFYALYPHLTVKDNISFSLRAQGLPAPEVERRVSDVAKRLRISHLLHQRPGKLPGGEQQRVALGRAMVRQPQVFLMDEPLTNLDAALRADMRAELKHLQHELATTMVYVTHDQVEAMSMSHRIAVMNKGVLEQLDTPLNIYRHPQTLFVATFIGSPPMNIIECYQREGALHTEGGFHYQLPAALKPILTVGQSASFGIRAEDLRIVPNGSNQADLAGVVTLREPLGDETLYLVDVSGQLLSVKAEPTLILSAGDRVGLVVNPTRVHLFHIETQKSLIRREVAHV
jgi:ABC-type sugar transport system ATPase subunit